MLTPWAHSSSVLKSGPPDGHRVTRRGTHGPVVVDVTQLVRQPLDVVRLQAAAVIDDVVMCGRHTAASHRLAHDKKVVPGITDTHKPRGRSGFPLRMLEGRGFTFPTARRPCTTTSAGPAGHLCLCVCVSVCLCVHHAWISCCWRRGAEHSTCLLGTPRSTRPPCLLHGVVGSGDGRPSFRPGHPKCPLTTAAPLLAVPTVVNKDAPGPCDALRIYSKSSRAGKRA